MVKVPDNIDLMLPPSSSQDKEIEVNDNQNDSDQDKNYHLSFNPKTSLNASAADTEHVDKQIVEEQKTANHVTFNPAVDGQRTG